MANFKLEKVSCVIRATLTLDTSAQEMACGDPTDAINLLVKSGNSEWVEQLLYKEQSTQGTEVKLKYEFDMMAKFMKGKFAFEACTCFIGPDRNTGQPKQHSISGKLSTVDVDCVPVFPFAVADVLPAGGRGSSSQSRSKPRAARK